MNLENFKPILANQGKDCKKSSAWPGTVIGLTGGIAAGKSSVAALMAEAGIPVVDTDELAREATAPDGPCLRKLVEFLGAQILAADGSLNRRRLLELIIGDKGVRGEVERIIHPEVFRRLDKILIHLGGAGSDLAVVEVPLLFEAGWSCFFDKIICVTAPREDCIRRLMERNGVNRETALAWMDLQLDQEEKARRSDFVIVNDADMSTLRGQVKKILQVLQIGNGNLLHRHNPG